MWTTHYIIHATRWFAKDSLGDQTPPTLPHVDLFTKPVTVGRSVEVSKIHILWKASHQGSDWVLFTVISNLAIRH